MSFEGLVLIGAGIFALSMLAVRQLILHLDRKRRRETEKAEAVRARLRADVNARIVAENRMRAASIRAAPPARHLAAVPKSAEPLVADVPVTWPGTQPSAWTTIPDPDERSRGARPELAAPYVGGGGSFDGGGSSGDWSPCSSGSSSSDSSSSSSSDSSSCSSSSD